MFTKTTKLAALSFLIPVAAAAGSRRPKTNPIPLRTCSAVLKTAAQSAAELTRELEVFRAELFEKLRETALTPQKAAQLIELKRSADELKTELESYIKDPWLNSSLKLCTSAIRQDFGILKAKNSAL